MATWRQRRGGPPAPAGQLGGAVLAVPELPSVFEFPDPEGFVPVVPVEVGLAVGVGVSVSVPVADGGPRPEPGPGPWLPRLLSSATGAATGLAWRPGARGLLPATRAV